MVLLVPASLTQQQVSRRANRDNELRNSLDIYTFIIGWNKELAERFHWRENSILINGYFFTQWKISLAHPFIQIKNKQIAQLLLSSLSLLALRETLCPCFKLTDRIIQLHLVRFSSIVANRENEQTEDIIELYIHYASETGGKKYFHCAKIAA